MWLGSWPTLYSLWVLSSGIVTWSPLHRAAPGSNEGLSGKALQSVEGEGVSIYKALLKILCIELMCQDVIFFFCCVGIPAEECRPDRFHHARGSFHCSWSRVRPWNAYTWNFNPPGLPVRGSTSVNARWPRWSHRWPCERAPGKGFLLEQSFEGEGGGLVIAVLLGWPRASVFPALRCAWSSSPPSRSGTWPRPCSRCPVPSAFLDQLFREDVLQGLCDQQGKKGSRKALMGHFSGLFQGLHTRGCPWGEGAVKLSK